jgi:hypothetical protein
VCADDISVESQTGSDSPTLSHLLIYEDLTSSKSLLNGQCNQSIPDSICTTTNGARRV